MSNFYVGEVLFETGGTIDTPGDINVTAICDCTGSTGTAGQLLSSTGTALEWITAGSAGIPCSILTAKGDMIVASAAGTPVALPVGANGRFLVACSACTEGVAWATLTRATPTVFGVVYGQTNDLINFNTAFGNNSLNTTLSGERNVAIGPYSLFSATTGSCNTVVGMGSADALTTGLENTVVGTFSLGGASGSYNTFVGNVIGQAITTGSCNASVGRGSLDLLTTGCLNVAVGFCGGKNVTTGSQNVAIGPNVQVASATASCQLAIGFSATGNWLTGDSTKAIKPGAGIIDCAGSCGTNGQVLTSNGSNAICWGTITQCTGTVTSIVAGTGLTGGTITTTGTIALDTTCVIQPSIFTAKGDLVSASAASTPSILPVGTTGQILYACSAATSGLCWASPPAAAVTATPTISGTLLGCSTASLTALGCNALLNSTAIDITAVGICALCANTTGNGNTAVGAYSMVANNTGANNTVMGCGALRANTTGANNVAIGVNANAGGLTAPNNTVIGANAFCASIGNTNVVIGACAGCTMASGNCNVIIGPLVNPPAPSGGCQLAIGYGANYWLTGLNTKAIRPGAGIIDCTGSCGTAGQVLASNGSNAICWITPGGAPNASPTVAGIVLGCTDSTNNNTGLGCNVFAAVSGATNNVAIGGPALCALTNGTQNVAVGYAAGWSATSASYNTIVGPGAMTNLTTGPRNTGIGQSALGGVTTGGVNVGLGQAAGSNITTGSCNVAIGPAVSVADGTADAQLAIGYSNTCLWLTGTSTNAIKPGAGIIDCAGSCGTAGQVLCSTGSNAIQWATPQTSPYVTYTSAPVAYTSGTPLLVAIWGGGTMQGTFSLDLVGYGGVQNYWNVFLSGDPTNFNTGWNQTDYWPPTSNPNTQGTWSVDFPVYPDPNANQWMIYFNPTANSINNSPFTFFYRLLNGGTPNWQI